MWNCNTEIYTGCYTPTIKIWYSNVKFEKSIVQSQILLLNESRSDSKVIQWTAKKRVFSIHRWSVLFYSTFMKFYSLHFPIVSGCSGKIFTTSSHSRQRKGSPPSPPGISPGDLRAQEAGWSEKNTRRNECLFIANICVPFTFVLSPAGSWLRSLARHGTAPQTEA